MKTELTRKKAIEEGFSKAGYHAQDWQAAQDIDDFDDNELINRDIRLFSKDSFAPSISPEHLSDLIADNIASSHGDDTGDDTDGVYDIVKSLDFSQTSEMINESLSSYKCWTLTEIRLIP